MVMERNGGKGGQGDGSKERDAGASGVVEILQQRTSPLLSNVHLILQILQDDTIGFMLRTTSHDINLVNSTIT